MPINKKKTFARRDVNPEGYRTIEARVGETDVAASPPVEKILANTKCDTDKLNQGDQVYVLFYHCTAWLVKGRSITKMLTPWHATIEEIMSHVKNEGLCINLCSFF